MQEHGTGQRGALSFWPSTPRAPGAYTIPPLPSNPAAGVGTTSAAALYADTGTPYFAPVETKAAPPEDSGSSTNIGMIVGIAVGVAAVLAGAAGEDGMGWVQRAGAGWHVVAYSGAGAASVHRILGAAL